MRDEERVRRNQSGVLLGLGVGALACALVWLVLAAVQLSTEWIAPWHPSTLAGAVGLTAMLAAAKWGAR